MSPDQEIPEREQRVAELLTQANSETRAPDALHARIGALREGGQRGAATFWRAAPAAVTALAVVVVAVLALTMTGGRPAGPTLDQVAALSGRGPAGPAPGALTPTSQTLLTAAVGDLSFPNWESHGGWRKTGEQTDKLDGREVATVFYSNGRTQLTYSIVASPALPGSSSSQDPYAVLQEGDQVTVVWIVHHHTCVLSANQFTPQRLWKLASTTLD